MNGIFLVLAGDTVLSAEDWPAFATMALGLAIVGLCVVIYGRLLASVLAGHGKVRAEPYQLPDILVVLVLCTWLGAMVVHGFSHPDKLQPVTDSRLFESGGLFGAVVCGIVLLLRARNLSPSQVFGLRSVRACEVLKTAGRLVLAMFPLVMFSSFVVQLVGGEQGQEQDVVQYFRQSAQHADWGRMALTAVFATVVAPVLEEFIFRGYFYGVLRRFFGVIPALVLTSALFAAIHLNVPSLLPLFVLAGCLTLAYEASGSLFTPMLMHASFNAAMLGMMVYKSAPQP